MIISEFLIVHEAGIQMAYQKKHTYRYFAVVYFAIVVLPCALFPVWCCWTSGQTRCSNRTRLPSSSLLSWSAVLAWYSWISWSPWVSWGAMRTSATLWIILKWENVWIGHHFMNWRVRNKNTQWKSSHFKIWRRAFSIKFWLFFFFWELPVCYPDHRSSLNLLLAMAGVIVSCFDQNKFQHWAAKVICYYLLFNQSDLRWKPVATGSPVFSRASSSLPVSALSAHWLLMMLTSTLSVSCD